ncbi:MAG: hypothetical protein KDD51_13055 [Bdellovibrionales bacterium]|nr:hypothetical protein [Bdellovibrionales bacterium]
MKATALFFLLASMTSTPSRWDSRPSEILITNADLWKVNNVHMGKTTQAINYFENANVSTNKIDTTMKFLILDQNKVNTAEKAFIRFDYDREKETFSINSEKVVQKLRELKVGLPEGDLFFLPGTSSQQLFPKGEKKTNEWYLLPTSLLEGAVKKDENATEAPKPSEVQQFSVTDGNLVLNNQQLELSKISNPILSSALIEWGDPEAIQAVRNSLYKKAKKEGDDTQEVEELVPAQLYNKHYLKLPLEIKIENSNLGESDQKDATDEGKIEEVFLIKHRLRGDGPGFLWVKKDVEGKEVLFLIEVPVFNHKNGTYDFEIPARCFIDQVVTKRIKAADLSCLLPKNSEFEAVNACKSVKVTSPTAGNEEKKEAENEATQLRIVGRLPGDFNEQTDKPVTFWLKAREDLDIYELKIKPGADLSVETPPDENVYILDAATCQPKPLFPNLARVPAGK